MKKKTPLLSLALLLCTTLCNGQNEDSYHLVVPQNLFEYNDLTETVTTTKRHLSTKDDFIVYNKIATGYVVEVIPFSDNDSKNLELVYTDTKKETTKHLFISSADWDANVEETQQRSGITFGIINVPIKIRFANTNPNHRKRYSDLEGNANIGLSVAWFFNTAREETIYATGGISLTQIRVDQVNTANYVSTPDSRGGFSLFAGCVYKNKNFQLAGLVGADHAVGELTDYYRYHKKLWVGIGIGVGIFTINSDAPVKKN